MVLDLLLVVKVGMDCFPIFSSAKYFPFICPSNFNLLFIGSLIIRDSEYIINGISENKECIKSQAN